MPGTEPWIRVEHSAGWFKIPAWVEVSEVFEGALAGWRHTPRSLRGGEPRVTIPLAQLMALELIAKQLRDENAASSLWRPPRSSLELS